MKKLLAKLIVPLLFLAGLSLLLYPLVSNEWNSYRQSQLITTYDEEVAQKTEAGTIAYDTEMLQAQNYNDSLQPYILPDSFATAQRSEGADERYMSCLNLTGNGMMGYVQIPKIDVKLPIFHTTEEEVLQTAAGHLEGSSLPVGGEGNHAVISAHRGLPSATLFTDLDRLTEGDYFLLYILDEVLCYQVDQINVVDPEDTSTLAAEDGKDLVTLLTCTPYGVNSHRLLVRGSRVPYEEIEDEVVAAGALGPSLHTNYLLWVIVGLSVTGIFILLLFFLDRKRRKTAQQTLSPEEVKRQESREEQIEVLTEVTEGEAERAEEQTERSEKAEDQTEKTEGQTER
ncbi:MAG: class C sortase [Lachnospiraceae bacterium]|nr:class C sortase [Lachnospiraceae bacterium]